VKRRDLIRHLEKQGCEFFREGGKHTVYANTAAGKVTTIPRHREINLHLAKRICRALDIPEFS
jgi:predicted RNA binding protein YcfA (HicA-like mRNA interferase family)